jgi:hypothetical protein
MGTSKNYKIPAVTRWDQGFSIATDPDGTEWVNFLTYRTAALWAVRSQQRTGIVTVVFPRPCGWAYRRR